MSHVHFNSVFTIDEQIKFLEQRGWTIEKKDVTQWIQTGPYDRVGEYETKTKYYASKPTIDSEEMDRVFGREIEKRFKAFILSPDFVE